MKHQKLTTAIAVTSALVVVTIFFIIGNPFATSQTASVSQPMGNSRLIVQDERMGTGVAAKIGDIVTVQYVGRLEDGTTFDTTRGKQPFTFQMGDARIIAGWNAGLQGMKVGGKRLIIIPAELAYGQQQVGPIPPNATLIFEVELLQVQAPTASAGQ